MDNVVAILVHKAYLDILVLAFKKYQLLLEMTQRNDPHQQTGPQSVASFVRKSHIITEGNGLDTAHGICVSSGETDDIIRTAHAFDIVKDIDIFV